MKSLRMSQQAFSGGKVDMGNPAIADFGKTIKCLSYFNTCAYLILYVAFTAVFAMVYFSTWKPCYLNALLTFPQPTEAELSAGIAAFADWPEQNDAAKIYFSTTYRLEEDVTEDVKTAAMAGFVLNLVCSVVVLLQFIYVVMANPITLMKNN